MRLFLAIDIPKPVKEKLSGQLASLKKLYPDFQWVPPNNYHITVYFFGETSQLDRIKKELRDLLFDGESFYLYSLKLDLFINNKILIYTGFRREKKLEILAGKIERSFDTQKRSGKYFPHLTLARHRIPSKQQYFALNTRLAKLAIDIDFPVNSLILFESIIVGKTPIYKQIEKFDLI